MQSFLLIAAVSAGFAALAFLPERLGDGALSVRLWARLRQPLFLVLANVSAGVFLWRMAFKLLPALEARMMPVEGYAVLERDAWLPAVLLFDASLAQLLPARRRPLLIVPLFAMLGLVLYSASWRLDSPSRRLHERSRGPVCLQSTGYTCGPASAVTLLRTMGVEAGEGEMARLTLAHPRTGTSSYLTALALRRKFEDAGVPKRAYVEAPRGGTLESLPAPFLAGMEGSPFACHMVCVLSVGKDRVLVGDPARGPVSWSRAKFERAWMGIVVVVR
jgi:predicted double-glycine peptidase